MQQKKLHSVKRKHSQQCAAGPLTAPHFHRPNTFPAYVSKWPASVRAFLFWGSENVQSILVFCRRGPQQGPYRKRSFAILWRAHGRAETLVWADGMPAWQKADNFPAVIRSRRATPRPRMPQAGGGNAKRMVALAASSRSTSICGRFFSAAHPVFVIGILLVNPGALGPRGPLFIR